MDGVSGIISKTKSMIPGLLGAYSFLSAVTAKDNVQGLGPMIGKSIENITGFALSPSDSNGDGIPDKIGVRWTGGPKIARGIGEYVGNVVGHTDFWISLLAAVGPSLFRKYSVVQPPGELSSLITLIEDSGMAALKGVIAGSIFDPPLIPGGGIPSSPENARNPAYLMTAASLPAGVNYRQRIGQAYATGREAPQYPNEFFQQWA